MGRNGVAHSGRGWPSLALAAAVLAVGLLPLIRAVSLSGSTPLDLQIYLEGARVAVGGGDLYAGPVVEASGATGYFTYPPFAALAFVPLAAIPDRWATILWSTGTIAALVGIVLLSTQRFTRRLAPSRRPVAVALLSVAAAYTLPVSTSINYGQVGVVICLGLLVDTTRSQRSRGVLVGLATAIKLTPGLFIVYFLITRQWRAAATAVGTVALCWGAAAVVLTGATRAYFTEMATAGMRRIVSDWTYVDNQSLLGLTGRQRWPAWVWIGLVLATVALGLWRAWRAHGRGDELVAGTLVGLTTLLVSPISWIHHAVWLVPAMGVVLGAATSQRRILMTIALWGFACLFPINMLAPGSIAPDLPRPSGIAAILAEGFVLVYILLIALLPITARTAHEVVDSDEGTDAGTAAAAPGNT